MTKHKSRFCENRLGFVSEFFGKKFTSTAIQTSQMGYSTLPLKLGAEFGRHSFPVTQLAFEWPDKPAFLTRAWRKFNRLLGAEYSLRNESGSLKKVADQINSQGSILNCDAYFAAESPRIFSEMQKGATCFFYNDACAASIVDAYDIEKKLHPKTRELILAAEAKGIQNVEHAFFPTDWAAKEYCEIHGLGADRVSVVGIGPGFDDEPLSQQSIDGIIKKRLQDSQTLRFLFVGVDWKRKGGERSLELLQTLHQLRVPLELHTVGSYVSPQAFKVINHGTLNKFDTNELVKLKSLYRDSHYLLLASHAEASPHVLIEAKMYALPAIASSIMGIPDLISDTNNGLLLKFQDIPADARKLESFLNLDKRYVAWCESAHVSYLQKYQWKICAEKILGRIFKESLE